jgi:hypothetical protein
MMRDDDARAHVYNESARRFPRRERALYRGAVRLPHQAQVIQRDLDAETLRRYPGVRCHAFMLTDTDLQERIDGKPGTGLPYRFLIYSPSACSLNWKAFFSRRELDAWCAAYAVRLVAEPEPGRSFQLQLPELDTPFPMPLEEREETEP